MKLLSGIFGTIWMIGFCGNALLLVYAEWLLIRTSFWNMINPLLQIGAILQMITWPLFWICTGLVLIGYLGNQYFERQAE